MKIGELFKEVMGKNPSEYKSLEDLEKAIEKELGKKLDVEAFNSDLVPKRGNVFEVSTYSQDLDKELDERIERMRRICHP